MADVRVFVDDASLERYAKDQGLVTGSGSITAVGVESLPPARNTTSHRVQITVSFDLSIGELTKIAFS